MVDQLNALFTWLGTSASDLLGGAVLWLLDILISLLPYSPFLGVTLNGLPSDALGWLNWLLDVGGMMALMGLWLGCVLLYMVLHQILNAINSSGSIRGSIGSKVISLFQTITGGGE